MRAIATRGARVRVAESGRVQGGWSIPTLHLLFVWALTLLEFHFFLSNVVAQPLVYLVYLSYPPLLLMMALKGPSIIATSPRWVWYPPLFVLLMVAAITLPLAENKGVARTSLLYFLNYYSLALATALYIRSVRQCVPIIVMFVAQFAWFGLFAGTKGLVPWHPTLSNYDGFGGVMVQGAAICYWFAVAAKSRKVKLFLYGLAAYCVLGVVASFARAAFLSLVAVVGWIWLRSPRKVLTATVIFAGAIVVVVGATVIFDAGFFWKEIMSAFQEGTEAGTGAQRWEVWKVGFKVWMQHPIIGVGGGNFGAFAASHFRFGELAVFPNPSVLYGHNLHNAFMQVLIEFGLVGIGAFTWALWDFQKRNREIREAGAVARWAQKNTQWDLRYLALGLEAANIANVLSGMFYATLFMPWFFTIWIANRMLWAVTRPPTQEGPVRRVRGVAAGAQSSRA